MNRKDDDILLLNLFQNYISLEKEIQKRTFQISNIFCKACPNKCCNEEICRESVESKFLSTLIQKQDIEYDKKNGWMSPTGCRLNYGRPLVCYEFFCNKIRKSEEFQTSDIQQIIREFISIGNRTYGNDHLICIDNLKLISETRTRKIDDKLKALMNKQANNRIQTDARGMRSARR